VFVFVSVSRVFSVSCFSDSLQELLVVYQCLESVFSDVFFEVAGKLKAYRTFFFALNFGGRNSGKQTVATETRRFEVGVTKRTYIHNVIY